MKIGEVYIRKSNMERILRIVGIYKNSSVCSCEILMGYDVDEGIVEHSVEHVENNYKLSESYRVSDILNAYEITT